MTLALPLSVEYGHLESVSVHFDDFDAMGFVHNVRYALLVERAMVAFWTRNGHTFEQGRPTTPDAFNVVKEFSISYRTPIRDTGEVGVHFWIERLGDSSAVYAFRLLSADGRTVFADGRRVIIKLDQATLMPSPWTSAGRATAETLLRPAADLPG